MIPGRLGEVANADILPTEGELWTMDPDRLGGHPKEEFDETEKAEVRHVDGVSEAEKSHGEEDAEDGAKDDTVEEIDPRELCKLPARPRVVEGDRSFPGKTRQT